MVTRELIYSEIERLGNDELAELYKLIRQLDQAKRKTKKKGALSKIKRIKISAPKDLSINHDLFISGERRA
jgi:acyl-CoA-binding protein